MSYTRQPADLTSVLQTKLAESEDKVALMSQQIEQLQAERATLMDRNSILEQVCCCVLVLSRPALHYRGPVCF